MAEYANQRPGYGSSDSYGYSSYQQQVNQATSVAQFLADQASAARRVSSEQANPLLARPSDSPTSQAIAAANSSPPATGRAIDDQSSLNDESRAAAAQPHTEPADGVARFASGLPIEWRASHEADEVMEATAAESSNSMFRLEPLLAGILRVDLPALEAGVERFFSRLEELGDELSDADVAWRLGAWSLTAAGAAAALEFARAEAKNNRQREPLLAGGWRLPQPPRPKERPE
jgi:hypothetical protein